MEKVIIKDYLDGLKNNKIVGTICKKCGNIMFPLKPVCSNCGSFDVEKIESRGKGVIRNFTVIHVAPAALEDQRPYIVALIKLDENASIMGRLLGVDPNKPEDIKIGTKVTFEPLVENNKIVVAFTLQ